ncbi:MAG: hypothetical protein KJ970_16910 [Candidatus Eisenbacteria bacterium]|uniref:Uncharacterized protein n=1 Tax=Eiseniibacteriota bacterium TaxID=2212470 RepID=A0A948RZP8_UNCEI|nr:hypothetical protein [Candidatus Eisenbacteria bacterium]
MIHTATMRVKAIFDPNMISIPIALWVITFMIAGLAFSATAGGGETLAQDVEQLLRAADKDITAGQLAPAAEKIAEAEKKLAELKTADPRHRAVRPMTARLAAVQKRYQEALAAGPPETEAADAAAAAGATAQADAELMIALYDKYYPQLDLIHGNSLVYGIQESDAKKALADVEAAEALLPEFASELGRLADTYGTESMEIGNNLHSKGVKISGDPGGRLAYLIEATGKVRKSREASAVSCAQNAETLLGNHSGPITDARLKRLEDVKKLLVVGHELDPNNDKVGTMLAEIDDQISGASLQMEAEINAAAWAGNVQSFPGPGDTGALAKEALSFFRAHDGWGGRKDKKIEVLDVCVRGPWQVAERDIFGRVISWRLPIHVAVTDPDLRPRNIARVYELSILALEGSPDHAPQKPPFGGYWVGNSWMMRLDNF